MDKVIKLFYDILYTISIKENWKSYSNNSFTCDYVLSKNDLEVVSIKYSEIFSLLPTLEPNIQTEVKLVLIKTKFILDSFQSRVISLKGSYKNSYPIFEIMHSLPNELEKLKTLQSNLAPSNVEDNLQSIKVSYDLDAIIEKLKINIINNSFIYKENVEFYADYETDLYFEIERALLDLNIDIVDEETDIDNSEEIQIDSQETKNIFKLYKKENQITLDYESSLNNKISSLNISKALVEELKLLGIDKLNDVNTFSIIELRLMIKNSVLFDELCGLLIKFGLPRSFDALNFNDDTKAKLYHHGINDIWDIYKNKNNILKLDSINDNLFFNYLEFYQIKRKKTE